MRRRGPVWVLSAGLATVGLLAGCANPGLPKAPSLHLPEKAAALHAERVGEEVRLTWNTLPKTTDGELVKGAVAAAICRRVVAAKANACLPLGSAAVVPGPGSRVDTLPPALVSGPLVLLEYHVELANNHGRSAGSSDAFYAVGGAAPPTAGTIVAEPERDGMLIRWPASASAATMQVTRTWLNPPPPKVSSEATGSAGAPRRVTATPAFGASSSRDEVVMVAELPPAGEPRGSLGGMLDRSALDGGRYTYTAQRVQMVEVGGRKLEMRGAASPPVTATWAAIFPPPVVMGLVSIPGGGFGAAPSIDLSWEPEDDVLGYNVYRSVDGGAAGRVNAVVVTAAGYRDLQVSAGHRYRYTVTALGRHQTESAPSTAVVEALR